MCEVYVSKPELFFGSVARNSEQGSEPINSDDAACLASSMAVHYLEHCFCPGTQSKCTLLRVESLLIAVSVLATILDLALADCIASNAAWLSEHIAIKASRS